MRCSCRTPPCASRPPAEPDDREGGGGGLLGLLHPAATGRAGRRCRPPARGRRTHHLGAARRRADLGRGASRRDRRPTTVILEGALDGGRRSDHDMAGGAMTGTPGAPTADRTLRHHQGLRLRRCRGACLRRRRPDDPGRRVRRDHGTERVGQVDGDEHHRLPRHADRAGATGSWASTSAGSRSTSGRCSGATTLASSSRASTFSPAPRRSRMSSCR